MADRNDILFYWKDFIDANILTYFLAEGLGSNDQIFYC